ncbi:biopolymer transporter ExbD [Candidatus Sumerlaeota bacterium]|nr:biopolymer transporter ExbD [Candidatus Sumerlaeota bacterium]
MRLSKRHRQPLQIMSEMNVTNLVDTAFTLLITFMLVAPQLTHGVKIDLPNVKEAPPMSNEPAKTLVITIQKKEEGEERERVYVKYKTEERVEVEEIAAKIAAARQERPDLSVVIEGDENSSYGVFLRIVGAVKEAGVESIGMPSEPLRPRDRDRR